MNDISVSVLRDGPARTAALPALARLRIAVFREWPYLYEGSLDYEQDYLAGFAAQARAVLIVARDEKEIIGAATASPMIGQSEALREPMAQAGYDLATLFYFGESVLLPDYRGKGIGHAFFDEREAAARDAGAATACFCSVQRPAVHPLRPAQARDLAPFWRARGYAPVDSALASLQWRDVDQPAETPHSLQFWARSL